MPRLSLRPSSLVVFFLLALSLAIFAIQLRSLYTVPVADSIRWGGDETWLMREFSNQARHGVMSYPESFVSDSSNACVPIRTDGVLAGSMWGDALFYGVSGNLFFPAHDYVSIGRTVTAALGIILIASLFFIMRKSGVSQIISAAAIVLMVLSQGWNWATHSARYDILTGLTLIWYCYFLSRYIVPFENNAVMMKRLFFAGMAGVFAVCFSRHLLMLGFAATIVYLYRIRIWKKFDYLLSWILGSFAALSILSILYYFGAGEFSLFGRGGSMGSYSFVIAQIPLMRPVSRNVQLSNLAERFNLFHADSIGVLAMIGVAILLTLAYKLRQFQLRRNGIRLRIAIAPEQSFFLSCVLACTFVWLLAEGSRPYYLFHIVPPLIIGCAIVLELWREVYPARWFGEYGAMIALLIATSLGANRAIPHVELGDAIFHDQSAAITRLLHSATTRTAKKGRILFDVAGLDLALQDTSREILTLDMFSPPPNAESVINKLQANKIDYVVLRSSPVSSPFEPGRALLPQVLDSIGEVKDSALGFFYDDGRSYDAKLYQLIDQGLDTLKLYRVNPYYRVNP
jgi:hypothetical protein